MANKRTNIDVSVSKTPFDEMMKAYAKTLTKENRAKIIKPYQVKIADLTNEIKNLKFSLEDLKKRYESIEKENSYLWGEAYVLEEIEDSLSSVAALPKEINKLRETRKKKINKIKTKVKK